MLKTDQIITLNNNKIKKLIKIVNNSINLKEKELGYKLKDYKTYEKKFMQIAGELAFESYYNLDYINLPNNLNNINYEPQIRQFFNCNTSIIVFKDGYYPLVYDIMYKNIIFIKQIDKLTYQICGYAPKEIIKKYSSKKLVFKNLSNRSGFYGFDHLISLEKNLDELKKMIK